MNDYTRALDLFGRANLELDPTQLAEALWLAQFNLAPPGGAAPGVSTDADGSSLPGRTSDAPAELPVKPAGRAAAARAERKKLYAPGVGGAGDSGAESVPAAEIRLPGAAPLPNAQAIGRALRPLGRRRGTARTLQFDEEATAQTSAEAGCTIPRFLPAPERWFSVALVMEESAAMTVWREMADDLERLLARHGGFNQVSRWRLRFAAKPRGAVHLVSATGETQPVARLSRLAERQLILLMTDGVSQCWRDGRMAQVLSRWGRVSPVVLLQVMAERLWDYTALGSPTDVVRAVSPGSPNRHLSHWPRSTWTGAGADRKPGQRLRSAMAFPLVSLDQELIAEWARMLMHPGLLYTAVPLSTARPRRKAASGNPQQPTAEERIANFRNLVSGDAFRLAIYLSWTPLTLPVMRTVHAAMFARTLPAQLSEVLLGGLLQRLNPDAPIERPDDLRFEFHPGVRDLLQPLIRPDELPHLYRAVAEFLSGRQDDRFSLSAVLPHDTGETRLPAGDSLPFAAIFRRFLERFGLAHLFFPDEPGEPEPEPAGEEPLDLIPFFFTTVTLDERGKEISRRTESALQFVEDLGDGLTLEMVEVDGGSFLMGTSDKDVAKEKKEIKRYYKSGGKWVDWETPQHKVTLPPFYIGKFTITQAQWHAIAADASLKVERDLDPNPSHFKDREDSGNRPVEQISWHDAKEFCARLSRKTGREYRLPTEAEWEYACRAGTTTPFAFGETITPEIVNYDGNYPYAKVEKGEFRNETIPVGSLGMANAFGLFDMHGNVWEWCEDVHHGNYEGAPTDGSAWLSGGDSSFRRLRGGSWINPSNNCRSAYRNGNHPDDRLLNFGARVVVARVP